MVGRTDINDPDACNDFFTLCDGVLYTRGNNKPMIVCVISIYGYAGNLHLAHFVM